MSNCGHCDLRQMEMEKSTLHFNDNSEMPGREDYQEKNCLKSGQFSYFSLVSGATQEQVLCMDE